MQSVEYHAACKNVPKLGWATKENCRRPVRHHPTDVVSELVWCFDATPRLNNYEIHKHLEQKFEIGTKVLRVSQIAGWVSSEVKRRKEAALKAAATAARYLEQAVSSDGVIDSAQLEKEEQQVEDVFKSCMIQFDFASAVAMGMNPDVNLVKWKQNWRLKTPNHLKRKEQREAFEQDQLQKAADKQLRLEKKRQRQECANEPSVTTSRPSKTPKKPSKKQTTKGQKTQAANGGEATSKGQNQKQNQNKNKGQAEDVNPGTIESPVRVLLPGQAWSNCCDAALSEASLDKQKNCKDQSEGSECSKRKAKRGKRKRKPASR